MATKDLLKGSLELGQFMTQMLLADFTDAELLIRPVEGANHIAWQLGHVINTEARLLSTIPDAMPFPVPAGFAERHTKETAKLDSPSDFLTKAEYLELWGQVRATTIQVVMGLNDEQFSLPNPSSTSARLAPTIGAIFLLMSNHAMMHMGQVTVVRRKLGKPTLF